MIRLLLYILGVIIISFSLSFAIIYLNLLNLGYSFIDYVNFIIRRFEVNSIIIGIFLIFLALRKGKK